MSTRRIVTTIDDLDGSEGASRVQFSLADETYEIDLSEANASKLREALAPYMNAGRRLTKSGKPYVRINLDEQKPRRQRHGSRRR